jgi:ABC-type transport system substrate-binding protein
LCSQVDEARSDPDIADQLSLYQSASARVMETLPMVPLTYPTPLLVTRRNVAGLFPSPQGFDWYGRVFFASDWIYMPIVRR